MTRYALHLLVLLCWLPGMRPVPCERLPALPPGSLGYPGVSTSATEESRHFDFSLPNARVQRISADCDEGLLLLEFSFCNEGEGVLPAGTPWVLFHRDPRLFAADVLAQGSVDRDLAPDSCFQQQLVFGEEVGESFYLVLNLDPLATPPFKTLGDFPFTDQLETDYTDNLGSLIFSCNQHIFIPTGFSPNNDGINDLFYPRAGFGVERVLEFQVFNRWGEQVFSIRDCPPNDPTCGWDGNHRGHPAQTAVYIWKARLAYLDGREEVMNGEVTLVR